MDEKFKQLVTQVMLALLDGEIYNRSKYGSRSEMNEVLQLHNDVSDYLETLMPHASTQQWSGSECDIDPDGCWIDDATSEHVNATTNERTLEHSRTRTVCGEV